ncbi:MinD/ParA family protein [Microbacterium sp. NPDC058345]|uniref:nucleotide-binding protein n=1 Tax=Microbacterium sp. NPDC058345 TaxID=3346455 RepID=UPI00365687FC
MNPKNTPEPEGDDSLGVLDDTPSSDTTGIGLHGGTAQVSVSLPTDEDDDLADDGVIEGEIVSDLVIDTSAVADDVTVARMSRDTPDIVIELPADELPEQSAPDAEAELDESSEGGPGAADADEEIIIEAEPVGPGADDAPADEDAPLDDIQSAVAAAKAELREAMSPSPAKKPAGKAAASRTPAKKTSAKTTPATKAAASRPAAAPQTSADADQPTREASGTAPEKAETATPGMASPRDGKPSTAKPATTDPVKRTAPARAENETSPTATATPTAPAVREASLPARAEATTTAPAKRTPRPAAPAEEDRPVNDSVHDDDRKDAAGPAADGARPAAEVALTAKRLDDLGDASRESADLLTADRLLDPSKVSKPQPEGTWSHLLYTLSGGRINIGDSRKARERKQLTARIAAPLTGSARFVPVLSRKGGVGKTTVTALLGMALADARDDRVIAVDANPDRGTLAERVVGTPAKSVRDLVRAQHAIRGFHDISALVARDETRLDVLASDADPRVAEAFGDSGYRDVATVAAQYYSLVLTDSGTGIVHSVMAATLDLADQLVIVSGLSVDEARLASETLTWLETNGHAALARDAIVVLNQSTPGAPLVRLSELETHFATRAKHVLRIPYDPQIAGGGAIDFAGLQPQTRQAARELAAALIEGLRARAA